MTRDHHELGVERMRARIAALEQLLEVHEQTAIDQSRRYEETEADLTFLAEATTFLSGSLDPDAVLERLADLLVPPLADWCAIDVVEDGELRRLKVAHADPTKRDIAKTLEGYTVELDSEMPPADAYKTGRSILMEQVPESVLDATKYEEVRRLARIIDPKSLIVVPLTARGNRIGVLSIATAESGRVFDDSDLELVEDLAGRAALSVDNARLFRDVQRAERRFRDLVDGLDAIVWEADARTGRLLFVSQRAEQLLQYPTARWIDEPGFWLELIHPDDRELVMETRRAMIATPRNHDVEYRAMCADGRYLWLRDVVQVVVDDAGGAVHLRGITVDVTERKRAQAQSEAQHAVVAVLSASKSLDEAAPLLLESTSRALDWDAGLYWVEENGELRCRAVWPPDLLAADRFGQISRETVLERGEGLPGRVCETGSAAWIEDLAADRNFTRAAAAAAEGLRSGFALPVRTVDGVVGVLEFFSRQVREPDDELLRVMDSVGTQLGQFLQRRRAEEARRESEARKGAVIDASLDAIMTIDAHGTVLEFSPAAEKMFGWQRDEAIGCRLHELIVPERYRDAHVAGLQRFRETGDAPVLGKRLELAAVRSDGVEFPIELTITRVELGGPTLFTGFVRDITERKRAEDAIRRSRERAAFLAEVSRFLSATLDYQETLSRSANAAVPFLADWCIIDMLEPDGSIVRTALAHREAAPPLGDALALGYRYPPRRDARHGVARVIATGEPEWANVIPEKALLEEAAGDSAYLEALQSVGFTSYICAPLTARGRTFGAMLLLTSSSGRRYTPDDVALAEELAARAAMAVDHARLHRESVEIAQTLQRSLLPPTLPTVPGVELAARYQAAGERNEVGGDFYDIFDIGGGRWSVVIGDVCGKGAEAAAVTALARYTVRAAAMQTQVPSSILLMLNEALLRQRSDGRFCTVGIATLEAVGADRELLIACGGHPAPLVLRNDGTLDRITALGSLIGVFPDPNFTDVPAVLHPGDTMVFFTDGLTEARSGDTFFGGAPLEAALRACAGLDAATVAARLEASALQFQGGELRDDMAILVLRVVG